MAFWQTDLNLDEGVGFVQNFIEIIEGNLKPCVKTAKFFGVRCTPGNLFGFVPDVLTLGEMQAQQWSLVPPHQQHALLVFDREPTPDQEKLGFIQPEARLVKEN